jgi:hypothetical protein
MNAFKNMIREERGNGYKFVSSLETLNNKPVVETYQEGNDTLVLSFVRATPELRLNELMSQFLCYAAKQPHITKVKLEDDALFTGRDDASCQYRALLFRALIGKPSIYSTYKFTPTTNVSNELIIISNYTIEQARAELLPLKDAVRTYDGNRELFEKLVKAEGKDGEDLFGKYVVELPCNDMSRLINILNELATKTTTKIERERIHNDFLESLRRYYIANKTLIRAPECKRNEGGGMVRHRARSSSRTKKYRRNTRTHRRNFRKSSKKRSNHSIQ